MSEPKINRSPNQKSLWVYKRLLMATKPYWWLLLLGVLAILIRAAMDGGLTYSIKPLINKGFIDRNETFIAYLPPLILGLFTARGIAVFCSNYFISRVGRNLVMYYRRRLFEHFLSLPATFYLKTSHSRLLSMLVYNVEQVAEATSQALLTVLQSLFTVVALLTVMFYINWKLTLLFVMVAPFMFVVIQLSANRLRKLNNKVQNMVGEVSNAAHQGLSGYREIRIYGGEDQERDHFYKTTHKARSKELKVVVVDSLGTAVVQLLISIPIAAVLYIATLPHMAITAGSFGAIISNMLLLRGPLRKLTRVNNKIQKGVAGAQSIYKLLDEPVEQDDGHLAINRLNGHIVFDQVYFRYDGDQEHVLNGINLSIQQGQMIAIVGKSGAGKSTLINLLPRFYDPTSGRILLDGVDARQYHLKDLRKQFALVSQDIVLFNATIADNIAFGDNITASREAIERAAHLACVTEFAQKLEHGLDTLVGENGIALSSGQRQRIAIARAFLKDAPILLLDEATSALDQETEAMIQQALERLMTSRTTIVIAHRLSTIQNADQIVVLADGRVAEKGLHKALLEHGGEYARLYSGKAQTAVS